MNSKFGSASFFIILQLFFLNCHAKYDYKIDSIPLENGLLSAKINDITEDTYGYIWLATSERLLRFDGVDLKPYEKDTSDSTALQSHYISSLLVDQYDNLWIGTHNGLHLYDYCKDKFIHFKPGKQEKNWLKGKQIKNIIMNDEGLIWIATDKGLTRMDFPKREFIFFNRITDEIKEELNSLSNRLKEDNRINELNRSFLSSKGFWWSFNTEKIIVKYSDESYDLNNDSLITYSGNEEIGKLNVIISKITSEKDNIIMVRWFPSVCRHRQVFKKSHSDISIYYSVPGYPNYENLDYRYMLEGVDSLWQKGDAGMIAKYPNIPLGQTRTFKVQYLSDREGEVISEAELLLVTEREPERLLQVITFVLVVLMMGGVLMVLKKGAIGKKN